MTPKSLPRAGHGDAAIEAAYRRLLKAAYTEKRGGSGRRGGSRPLGSRTGRGSIVRC